MRFRTAGIFAIFVEHEAGKQNQLSCMSNMLEHKSVRINNMCAKGWLITSLPCRLNSHEPISINHPTQISFHEWSPAAVQQLNPCWQQQFNQTHQSTRFFDSVTSSGTLYKWPFSGLEWPPSTWRWNEVELGTLRNWHLFMMGYCLHLSRYLVKIFPILEMNNWNLMVGALEFWEGFGGLDTTLSPVPPLHKAGWSPSFTPTSRSFFWVMDSLILNHQNWRSSVVWVIHLSTGFMKSPSTQLP